VLLSPSEAARRLGISRKRIYQFIAAGRIAAEPVIGGGITIDEREVERFAALPRRHGRPRVEAPEEA
jgi:excisionase family DNA binding protein